MKYTISFLILFFTLFVFGCKKSTEPTVTTVTPAIENKRIKSGTYNWKGSLFEINYYNPNEKFIDSIEDRFNITVINDSSLALGSGTYILNHLILHFTKTDSAAKTNEFYRQVYNLEVSLWYNYESQIITYREYKEDTILGDERLLTLKSY